mmetsp:Transcript_24282/g.68225  ORF Transcript_24282/g.68225 Transcript_24282/m.68225 type:complete len:305 (+) Transcript_24282:30-944(+)
MAYPPVSMPPPVAAPSIDIPSSTFRRSRVDLSLFLSALAMASWSRNCSCSAANNSRRSKFLSASRTAKIKFWMICGPRFLLLPSFRAVPIVNDSLAYLSWRCSGINNSFGGSASCTGLCVVPSQDSNRSSAKNFSCATQSVACSSPPRSFSSSSSGSSSFVNSPVFSFRGWGSSPTVIFQGPLPLTGSAVTTPRSSPTWTRSPTSKVSTAVCGLDGGGSSTTTNAFSSTLFFLVIVLPSTWTRPCFTRAPHSCFERSGKALNSTASILAFFSTTNSRRFFSSGSASSSVSIITSGKGGSPSMVS